MTRIHVNQTPPPREETVHVHDSGDTATASGINLVMTLIALVVLVGLVALIFYGLPAWFGTSSVNVNIRTP
jgi:hypothetical protein